MFCRTRAERSLRELVSSTIGISYDDSTHTLNTATTATSSAGSSIMSSSPGDASPISHATPSRASRDLFLKTLRHMREVEAAGELLSAIVSNLWDFEAIAHGKKRGSSRAEKSEMNINQARRSRPTAVRSLSEDTVRVLSEDTARVLSEDTAHVTSSVVLSNTYYESG